MSKSKVLDITIVKLTLKHNLSFSPLSKLAPNIYFKNYFNLHKTLKLFHNSNGIDLFTNSVTHKYVFRLGITQYKFGQSKILDFE